MKVELILNGEGREIEASPLRRLLDVLREDLGLTGTKEGCGEGECGACTVLLDGAPVNACLVPIAQVHGHEVVTIEGASTEAFEHVRRALLAHGGVQCGMCTPGIALAGAAAITREPHATRARLRELIAGNLCRCTGYQAIIDAIADAAEEMRS